MVGATVAGSAVVDEGGASVVGIVVVAGSVDVEGVGATVVADVVAMVLGARVVVLEGGMAVEVGVGADVDVDEASGGVAAGPAHAATVRNAASTHTRNLMEQYYYAVSPLPRGEQPLRRL